MSALVNRVALVTGASSGIGRGLALLLAEEGASVALAARRGRELERVADEVRLSKHALNALTEVVQAGNHDNGIKAWVLCPGFVDTEMGAVVPGAHRQHFLHVDEVIDVARYLFSLNDNVKLGPEVLVRTMRNPMAP